MKENPKYTIPKPCNKRWNNMLQTKSSNEKFCQNCSEKVFDLRGKNKTEINNWYKENNENVCVIAKSNQLNPTSQNEKNIINFRKIGIASVIIGSSLLSPNIYAQEKKADTFTIEQTELQSDNIKIEGIVKVKALIGWKKLNEYNINVYSNDTLLKEVLIDEKGRFTIEINRKLMSDKMTISIHAVKYKSIRIEEIEVKDTMIQVFLEKRGPRIIVGRFY